MKSIVIVGATSGLGRQTALLYIARGLRVGVAGRNEKALEELRRIAPDRVTTEVIDVTSDTAAEALRALVQRMGGTKTILLSSGIGFTNLELDERKELQSVETNALGFTRMILAAVDIFRSQGGGHICAITSVARTKGIGAAAAYSATKRYQSTYIDALAQNSRMEHLGIRFTEIRPGFAATALLDKTKSYPMLMSPDFVAHQIVDAIDHRRRVKTIDYRYAILVFFWRLIPRCVWERLNIKN